MDRASEWRFGCGAKSCRGGNRTREPNRPESAMRAYYLAGILGNRRRGLDNMTIRTITKGLAAAALLCAGVGIYYADLLKAAFESNPIPRTAQSVDRGKQLFQQYCAVCHGPGGQGDGAAAASLAKRPDDLTRIAPPPYFPDGVVAYRIANGAEAMPGWKGTLSAEQIWDLINFIRSLHR
jgi:mono/diheme cytochrome c family protein